MAKRILIVDDSDFVRTYHSSILEDAAFDVITAGDGAEGLERLYAGEPCDLIMTDINMRRMDGYEFIRQVRQEDAYSEIPIIIVSTEGDGADMVKGFEAGANLYLVKPCSPAAMIENIQLILETIA